MIWMAATFIGFIFSFMLLLNTQELIYGFLPHPMNPDIATLIMMLIWLAVTVLISGVVLFALWKTIPTTGKPDIMEILKGKEPTEDEPALNIDQKAQFREEAMKLIDEDQFNDKDILDR